ncbi:MAG: 30S ribosomal protein S7 [Candidatus Marinimicrobia bacterium]|jgi:small subunit ribosomal protein S7|nr:30S ribosomal protein S7 [Candidatus Neomarinimicrobiota bacterium]MDD4961067.1 30S ribosomal protein S7 [Candidatus Neomarinimicrobiota bacterium]MDD5709183.1 30S ribosomal protein S7 [Candidatus Neomarinimicrobiota bacterium]
MSRRNKPPKRDVLPDPKYSSKIVTKFINNLMERGKKGVAEKIMYDAINVLDQQSGGKGLDVFQKALDNVAPVLEVKSKRIGGATYQVPVEVRRDRRYALAMRWIITYSTARSGNTMAQKLAAELMAASKGEGSSVKKKEDTHRMAEANRAFAHFSR